MDQQCRLNLLVWGRDLWEVTSTGWVPVSPWSYHGFIWREIHGCVKGTYLSLIPGSPCDVYMSHHPLFSSHSRPVRPIDLGLCSSKTVSWRKPFLPSSLVPLNFCYHDVKLTTHSVCLTAEGCLRLSPDDCQANSPFLSEKVQRKSPFLASNSQSCTLQNSFVLPWSPLF